MKIDSLYCRCLKVVLCLLILIQSAASNASGQSLFESSGEKESSPTVRLAESSHSSENGSSDKREADNREIKILFLGDSLTAGYGVDSEEAFPAVVGRMLLEKGYVNVRIVNAGISGSTSASTLSRLKWYLKSRPDILFLALGANDGLRGLPLQSMENNLDAAVKLAVDSGIEVILAGMEIPPNYGTEYTDEFRKVFSAIAEKYKISFMPFLLKDVGGVEKLNQPDGVHPNADGHRIVAGNVLPYIIEKL